MQDLPGGSMLSVRLSAAEVEAYLTSDVSVAAINGPQLCVIAGSTASVSKIQAELERREVVCKELFTSHAFHSPMMDPIVQPFYEVVSKITLNEPTIPILSTVTTEWMTKEEAMNPLYWADHLRATVKFADGIKALWKAEPQHIMLELGPRNTASMLARQQSGDLKTQKAIPSLGDSALKELEWITLLAAIGHLKLSWIRVDLKSFYALEERKRIPLPQYPFEHKNYWLDPPQVVNDGRLNSTNASQVQLIQLEDFNEVQQPVSNTMMSNRKENLINDIKEVLEEASGIEMNNADTSASFIELGLDSLFLTQIALTISKKYGQKVTFRQLNEDLSSLESLSVYLDEKMPADQMQSNPKVVSAAPLSNQQHQINASHLNNTNTINFSGSAPAADGNMVQWVISQQMQLMQQQLQMLNGQSINTPLANTPAPAPAKLPSLSIDKTPSEEQEELKKPFGAIARIEKTQNGQFSDKQRKWLNDFILNYNLKFGKSKEYTQKYRAQLADPRVVTGFKPHLKEIVYQPVVNRSLGSKIWDIDGNEYLDILNGFGSNMFGHNPPFIVEALQQQLAKGYELGPQHELAGEVARMVCEMTKSDRAGLCNTGSEAVLGAMRIARTVTGRSLIVSFNGSYHGINDEVILRGTKKLKSVPASAGIMPEAVQNMLVLDYGTPEALEIIKSRADEIAAVLVEPVQSRRADFQPKEFLQEVRRITEQTGSLLIFDEVITGFRSAPGGAQEHFGILADLGTYGKVVGGGMPIGVIAGKKQYMDALDGGYWQYGDSSVPEIGVTYFAGTFVRHPFVLATAKASLQHMIAKGPSLQKGIGELASWLTNAVNDFAKEMAIPFHMVNFTSLFKPKYDQEMANIDLLYFLMRYKGVHLYDGFPCFLTEAHTKQDVEFIASVFIQSLKELAEFGFIPSKLAKSENLNGHSLNGTNGIVLPLSSNKAIDKTNPPIPGAKVGKNPDGTDGWYVPDPNRPGKYLKLEMN